MDSDYGQYEDTNISNKLECLHKEDGCKSKDCEYFSECKNPTQKTHCYAIINHLDSNLEKQNTKFNIKNPNNSSIEVLLAGCWTGGDECQAPNLVEIKYKLKYQHHLVNTSYKVPNSLLDPSIQNYCIGYAKEPNDNSYFAKNNQSFCCCNSNLCNQNIYLSSEYNPFEMYALELNPKLKNSLNRTTTANNQILNTKKNILTKGELNAILSTSLVFILIFFLLFLFVLIYKKKLIKLKLLQFNTNTDSSSSMIDNNNKPNSLPSIFYSKTNTIDINSPSPTMNVNSQTNQLGNKLICPNKEDMINNYLNFKPSNNKIKLSDNEEFKSITQPLLAQTEGVFQSAMIAPNIQVIPDDLFKPIKNQTVLNNNNFPNLINRNDLKDLENAKASLEQQFMINKDNYSYGSNSSPDGAICSSNSINQFPQLIKCSDLYLIEKISQGQFSSVWKGRCVNSTQVDDQNLPEYAIKIFSAQQKTAWSNEKDIYNTLSTINPNILKYFCSDVHELSKSSQQQSNSNSSFPFFSNNEYWIITEYHQYGSLNDFLKLNFLTWSQMVNIAYSILEGLAYLHSENSDSRKAFAIAHRDLKSKNILVKKDGQTCCIADFGLALKLNNHHKLSSAEIRSKVGTRRYMSPELIEGAIAFSKETFLRIDVYACALVLWEVISRGDFYEEKNEYKLPFEEEVGQNPSLEDMKEIVVDKCIRPNIKSEWLEHYQIASIAQTIEECWDVDLDARISSECASSRIRKIYLNIK